jgi:hypothetical protein
MAIRFWRMIKHTKVNVHQSVSAATSVRCASATFAIDHARVPQG